MTQELPICVADWDDEHPPDMLGCACGFERKATEDEIGLSDGLPWCPTCHPPGQPIEPPYRSLEWKYQAGATCHVCGALDWSMPIQVTKSPTWIAVCSRKCQLQHEYAESLKA